MDINPETLLKLLENASVGGNPELQREANEILLRLQSSVDTYIPLLGIISAIELNSDSRIVALAYLKQSISQWFLTQRLSSSHPLALEKPIFEIRNVLLQLYFQETNTIILRIISSILSQLALKGSQNEFVELYSMLMNLLKSRDFYQIQKGMEILNEIVEDLALSSCKNGKDYSLIDLAPDLTETFIFSLEYLSTFYDSNRSPIDLKSIDICCLSVCISGAKIVAKTLEMYKSSFRGNHDLLTRCSTTIYKFIDFYFRHVSLSSSDFDFTQSHVSKLAEFCFEILLVSLDYFPIEIKDNIASYLSLTFSFLMDLQVNHLNSSRDLIVFSITFVNRILTSRSSALSALYLPHFQSCQIESYLSDFSRTIDSFFSDDIVCHLATMLVNKIIKLSETDLLSWKHDPEAFYQEIIIEKGLEKIRPAGLLCFRYLFQKFPQIISKFLGEQFSFLLRTIHHNSQTIGIDLALVLESFVSISEIHSFAVNDCLLSNGIDLGDYIIKHIVSSTSIYQFPFLRAIIASFLVEWIQMEFLTPENLSSSMLFLLSSLEDNDIVVNLIGIKSFQAILSMEDFPFDALQFHSDQVLKCLSSLVQKCSEDVSREMSLQLLDAFVEQYNSNLQNSIQLLSEQLSLVWSLTNHDQHLLAIIIEILTKISRIHYPKRFDSYSIQFVFSVVKNVTDPNNYRNVYLREKGIQLWEALSNSAHYLSQELVDVFANWSFIFENNIEDLQESISILESYVLLGKVDFFLIYGERIVFSLCKLLKSCNDDGVGIICQLLQTMLIQMAENLFPYFVPVVELIVGEMIAMNNDRGQETFIQYVSILARICYFNFAFLTDRVQPVSLWKILEIWLLSYSQMFDTTQRKLNLFGLLQFLTIQDKNFNFYHKEILNATKDLISDLGDDELYDLSQYFASDPNEEISFQDLRRLELMTKDPINNVKLKDAANTVILKARAIHGGNVKGCLLDSI